jgi:hypothetical protein
MRDSRCVAVMLWQFFPGRRLPPLDPKLRMNLRG